LVQPVAEHGRNVLQLVPLADRTQLEGTDLWVRAAESPERGERPLRIIERECGAMSSEARVPGYGARLETGLSAPPEQNLEGFVERDARELLPQPAGGPILGPP
jgi:hypothetical protein